MGCPGAVPISYPLPHTVLAFRTCPQGNLLQAGCLGKTGSGRLITGTLGSCPTPQGGATAVGAVGVALPVQGEAVCVGRAGWAAPG